MNAEIIDRLDQSFKGWPKITWSDDHFERLRQARPDQRRDLEKEIAAFARDLVERELPSAHTLHSTLSHSFYRLLNSVPEEEREPLKEAFVDLSIKLSTLTAKGREE